MKTNKSDEVVEGLERCQACLCDDCSMPDASRATWDCPAYDKLITEAIDLLKAQQPIVPSVTRIKHAGPITFNYKCGSCFCGVMKNWVACPICGQRIKWEEEHE